MKSALAVTVTVIGIVLLIQGCGGTPPEKVPVQKDAPGDLAAVLEKQLNEVRQDLARQQARNNDLVDRIQSLTERLSEKDQEVTKALDATRKSVSDSEARSKGSGSPDRIGLLGAKALAEHKAAQLSKRLDTLTTDLKEKEQALESIRANAKQKEEQVATLTQRVEQLREENETRTAELSEKMRELTRQLSESTAASRQFKQELKEKEELLAALKNAVNDASRLKDSAEKEVERLAGTLADTMKKLETSQKDAEHQRQIVSQLSGQLEGVRQESAALAETLQNAKGEIERFRSAAEGFRQENERLFGELKQARELAQQSQQEAEQYRAQGEEFRTEAVKLRVEFKRTADELEELKKRSRELAARVRELEGLSTAKEETEPSAVDRVMESGRPSAAGKAAAEPPAEDEQKPQRPIGLTPRGQAGEAEIEEQPYEAPSFDQLEATMPPRQTRSEKKPRGAKEGSKMANGKPGADDQASPVSDLY